MKKDILLLTGWGATCTVWEPIIPVLTERFHINCLTPSWLKECQLESSLCDIESHIEELSGLLQQPVSIVAWSMGGLLAIRFALRFPALVESIVFISSAPKFICVDNAHAGIDYEWFKSFENQYRQEPLATLKKFLTLQVKGDAFARPALRVLKNACNFDDYNLAECGCGLNLMRDLDLSKELTDLACKTTFIHGGCDAIVDVEAAQYAAMQSHSTFNLIKNAGHAPHISHPKEVIDLVISHLK